jgi:DNA polymerase/3'-5' exonuclease PolX
MSTSPKRPLAEMEAKALALIESLRSSCERIEVAGSIRRRCAMVGDIEIVAIPRMLPVPELFVGQTSKRNALWETLDAMEPQYVKRGEKYRQALIDGVTADLFTATAENFGLIHLIRTGSADFSRHVVTQLRTQGYCSDGGKCYRLADGQPVGDPISTPEEGEVFRLAGMLYVEPEKRSL